MRRAKGSLHVATCTRNKIRVKAGHLFSPSSSLEARLILRWGVFVQRGAKLVIGSLEPNRSTIWKLRRILVLVRGGRGGELLEQCDCCFVFIGDRQRSVFNWRNNLISV